MNLKEKLYEEILEKSFTIPLKVVFWDGKEIEIGENASNKIIFNKEVPWEKLKKDATLTLAEAYMNKDIEIEGSIQELMVSAFSNEDSFTENIKYKTFNILHKHDRKNSQEDIKFHYDIGNDFYKYWLDDSMTYSCAYFKEFDNSLEEAQEAKIDHILKKLRIQKEDRLLDIGCGWGQLVIEAAKRYGIHATGITLSQEQYQEGQRKIKEQNLENLAEIKIMDYREMAKGKDKFSKIVSVGMFEHVGKENISEYINCVNRLMEDNSLALIHGISGQRDIDDNSKGQNTFLNKYIFPGGYIPSLAEIVIPVNKLGLHLIDMESMRRHYQLTLEEWQRRFVSHWEEIEKEKDEKFMRMWDIYLQGCAAIFEAGKLDVCQYLIEKGTDNTRPLTRKYMYE
ncbi:MAG: class I SAM-dependent methyltransferase [Anaerococcus sp.]